jgi:hypothetical protein
MPKFLRSPVHWFIALLTIAPLASAYEYPLSSTAIRNAYFLGTDNNEQTSRFLAEYVKRPPLPKAGPHVSEIEVRTPYEQVVLHARDVPGSYSAQDAEQDYRAHPGSFLVRVRIELTPTYSDLLDNGPGGAQGVRLRPADFWRDFSIHLIQQSEVKPKRIIGWPVHTSRRPGAGPVRLVGAEVRLEYDPAEIASAPAQIEVVTPDGQQVVTEFDLAKLK